MQQKYNQNAPVRPPEEEEAAIDVMEILGKCLRYWYWFALGLMLALAIAYWYVHYTPKAYKVEAVLQIKDDKGGGMSNIENDILSQLTLMSGSSNIQNEIVVLKSFTLVSRVVHKLGLRTVCLAEDVAHASRVDLYKKAPVILHPLNLKMPRQALTLSVSTADNKTFTISDEKGHVNIPAGEIAHLPSGDFMLRKNTGASDSLYKNLTFIISPLNLTVNNYIKRLHITQTDKASSSLNLTIKTTVPDRGEDFLNTLLKEYQQMGMKEKNEMATNTIHFVSARLDSLMHQLNTVETQLATFMSNNGMANIDAQSQLFLEQVGQVEDQLSQGRMKLSILQEIEQYMNRGTTTVPSTMGIKDPTLLSLIQKYNEAVLQRSMQIQAGLKPTHPIIQNMEHQIVELRAGIKTTVQNLENGVKISLQSLENQSGLLEKKIREVPGLQKQFLAIKRKHQVKQALYDYLLQKREEAAITREAAVNNSIIVDHAKVHPIPVAPRGQLIYLAALLIGLALPGAMLYLKETFNHKISSKKEIEAMTAAPLYAEIMMSKKDNPLIVKSGVRGVVSEQFRNLRTNLNFVLGRDERKKTILITSGMSGEGKSFVSLNLAMTYALLGKRTVLLNLDLRRPKLELYLKLSQETKPGISNYLSGDASPDELPNELTYGKHNLFFINSGPVPPNPAELMLQPEMDQLIAYLKQNFDYILLDTPPVGIVADAQILSKYADASLYIVRHDYTKKDQVKMMDNIYREKKFPGMGIVLNGIKSRDSYRYGYGYGYGYGYYDNGNAKSSVYNKIKESLKNR